MKKIYKFKYALYGIVILALLYGLIICTAYIRPITSFNSSTKDSEAAISRYEALKEIVIAFGANDTVFEYHVNIDHSALSYTPDVEWYYVTSCADDWGIMLLQPIYFDENNKTKIVPVESGMLFQVQSNIQADLFGEENMSVKEAAVIIQSLFEADDIEYDYNGHIIKGSTVYKQTYKNAVKNGIIKPIDMIYWSPIDVNISKRDLQVLLARAVSRLETTEIHNKRYLHDKAMMSCIPQ